MIDDDEIYGLHCEIGRLEAENDRLRQELDEYVNAYSGGRRMSGVTKYYQLKMGEDLPSEFCAVRDENGEPSEYTYYVPEAENAKLREQMDNLVTLLRNDCDIDASWDGLRRFWCIGLTEGGVLMRDRACKAEADNSKLREQVDQLYAQCVGMDGLTASAKIRTVQRENAKLRDALKTLMVGTYAELCADRDAPQCKECSMCGGLANGCAVSDAMELLGIDMYEELCSTRWWMNDKQG